MLVGAFDAAEVRALARAALVMKKLELAGFCCAPTTHTPTIAIGIANRNAHALFIDAS